MPTSLNMDALVLFFGAVAFVQLSAFLAFMVPPRNWQQFAFYRRAYAHTAPWRLRIGRVGVIISLVGAGIYGILAVILAMVNVLVPKGLATAQDVNVFIPLLLLMGTLSLVVSATTHWAALRARRNTQRFLAQDTDIHVSPSETAAQ